MAVRKTHRVGQGSGPVEAANGRLVYVAPPRSPVGSAPREILEAVAARLVQGASAGDPCQVTVLRVWQDVPWPERAAWVDALEHVHALVRWLHAPGPAAAEQMLCASLRASPRQRWLVFDANEVAWVARSRGGPQVPDAVRLVRLTGALVVGCGSAHALRCQVPLEARFSSWAEKIQLPPVFCG